MGADCKSVGVHLRRFESCTCHHHEGSSVKRALRRLPGWHSLVLARQLVAGGEPRQNAVARILRPDNLFQPQGTTAYGRYAEELEAAKDALATSTPDILSFGCSSGEELLTLRSHFPGARIR